jgi:hypothetical protein
MKRIVIGALSLLLIGCLAGRGHRQPAAKLDVAGSKIGFVPIWSFKIIQPELNYSESVV